MQTGRLAAHLGRTAEAAVVVVRAGAAGHRERRPENTGVTLVGVDAGRLTALLVVRPRSVLADGDVARNVVGTVVTHAGRLVERADQRTLVAVIVECHAAGELVRTAAHGHLVTLVERRAEHLVDPVGARQGHFGVLHGIPQVRDLLARGLHGRRAHRALLLHGQRLGQVVGRADAVVSFVGHLRSAVLGLLGGHQNDTCGSRLGTVDGGRCGVLQHDHRLDVVDREGSARNAVHHPQHALVRLRAHTANGHGGCGGRVAAIIDDRNARDLALENTLHRADRTALVLLDVAQHAHRGRKVGLAGCGAETEHDHVVHRLRILFEHDVECGGGLRHGHLARHIADIGDLKHALRTRNGHREGARQVGGRTHRSAFHDHAGSDDRTVLVLHGTRNLKALCEHTPRYHEHQRE